MLQFKEQEEKFLVWHGHTPVCTRAHQARR